jgi:hypothetical protein
LSKGALPDVKHFDSKAAVESYIRELGIPATFFLPGFFMSNLPGGALRQSPEDNAWTLALPLPGAAPMPLFDTANDAGKFVKGILLNREKVLGKRIYGATDYYTVDQIAEQFKEQYPEAGKTAKTVELPHAVFKGIMAKAGRGEVAEELLQNMRLMSEFGYYGGDDLKESHSVSYYDPPPNVHNADFDIQILVDKLTTWKEFMAQSKVFADLK